MAQIIRFHAQSRIPAAIEGLLRTGWKPQRAPDQRILPRNGQSIVLSGGSQDKRIRLFAYTVTESSRNRPHERRVEITSTYAGGLLRSAEFEDIVIAYERATGIWVGIDGRRLDHGGATHNASTFLPAVGFFGVPRKRINILPMESSLFSPEYCAFFTVERLAEYIFNRDLIHSGSYDGKGRFSGNVSIRNPARLSLDEEAFLGNELVLAGPASTKRKHGVRDRAVQAIQEGDVATIRRLRISREELLETKRRCDEIGLKGERWVLGYERRRLRRAGRRDLAIRIEWVSQTRPYEGYDIASFEVDGARRYVEVKATVSASRRFEISENEWKRAQELRGQYQIYRVTNVEGAPGLRRLPDPAGMLADGSLTREPSSWSVAYN